MIISCSRLVFFTFILTLSLLLVFPALSLANNNYIIVLKSGESPGLAAKRHKAQSKHVFTSAIRGYSASLSLVQVEKIRKDPNVLMVSLDMPVSALGKQVSSTQTVPTGIRRINTDPAFYNGVDDLVNVDVAVIDTGIDTRHRDLNVVGGKNCSTGRNYTDGNGHGTHVAGTIAARDNNLGVAGVVPGARLHAVRVLDNNGSGTWSSVICGIDWVTANAATIEVANMSLGGPGGDSVNCGAGVDALHMAVCNSVAAGITYVVAAGNDALLASTSVPAAYDEVITVSAYADFDGLSGGLGGASCYSDQDDSFARFSNYGEDVDISAPGVCILSTWTGNSYNTISGTSMASPHVAGAAALYKSQNPLAGPEQVKAAIQASRDTTPVSDDRDSVWEGLLNLRSLLL